MPKRKLRVTLGLSFVITALIVVAGTAAWRNYQIKRFQHMSEREQAAYRMQAMGVMSSRDYMSVDALAYSIAKTGRISDSDLTQMLALLKAPASAPTKQNDGIRSAFVTADLREVKYFTASQKEKVLQVCLPMTSSSNKGDVESAVGMLATLDDSRAVPYIRPLLNDSDSMVRYYAWRALHHLHALPATGGSD